GNPKITIPRSPGHHNEFVMACKGEKPREFSKSNFAYSGPMTAKITLGNIALKVGKKIEWDGEKITNIPEANQFIRRKPRKGWEELTASG
ncbi:MAG: hypothetical protein R3236_08800, partial [Phycisphaeraceae bacterium]|nr:hypothetical protein [Phycisphaeraceae bacterium]